MRMAKLFLVNTLLALLLVPSLARGSEVGERFEKVVKEHDLAVESFKSAERKSHFKSRGEAEQIRAELGVADTLLKDAHYDLRHQRPYHADARVGASNGLIKEAYEHSTGIDQSAPDSSETDTAGQTSDKESPALHSKGPKVITAPSSD